MYRPGSADWIRLLARQAATTALDLLFPPHCAGCDRVGSLLCPRCLARIVRPPARRLEWFDDVAVCAEYQEPISTAIHAFKYDGQVRLAEPLGALLLSRISEIGWPVDAVCAVPLHPSRQRERGYNQAELLAAVVARTTGWRLESSGLRRVRETASQVHLDARQRRDNVDGAFAAEPDLVSGQRVLLVDDVLTTGATLSACACALCQAGAARVYGATIAGAVFTPQV